MDGGSFNKGNIFNQAFNCQILHSQVRSYYYLTPLFLEKDPLRGVSQKLSQRRFFDIARRT